MIPSHSRAPRAAVVLGWLGVLPLAALASAVYAGRPLPRDAALSGLVVYGCLILSFLGGAQWGLAIATPQGSSRTVAYRLAISVLPSLAAFGAWYLPITGSLLGLVALFVAWLIYDIATVRDESAPAWYAALRIQLTSAVVVCLLCASWWGRH
jgi:hypothetical protein